jgi:hypothetical protein
MKIIITENRLNSVILKWLDNKFGNLTEVVKGNYTQYVDQDGYVLISYLTNVKEVVLIDYIRIWRLLINIFGMKSEQIQDILKIWLEETYNLKEIMPLPIFR